MFWGSEKVLEKYAGYEKLKQDFIEIWKALRDLCLKEKKTFGVLDIKVFAAGNAYGCGGICAGLDIYEVFDMCQLKEYAQRSKKSSKGQKSVCYQTSSVSWMKGIDSVLLKSPHLHPYNNDMFSITPARLFGALRYLSKLINKNNIKAVHFADSQNASVFFERLEGHRKKVNALFKRFRKYSDLAKGDQSVALCLREITNLFVQYGLPAKAFFLAASYISDFYSPLQGRGGQSVFYSVSAGKLYNTVSEVCDLKRIRMEIKGQNCKAFARRINLDGSFTEQVKIRLSGNFVEQPMFIARPYSEVFCRKPLSKSLSDFKKLVFASVKYKASHMGTLIEARVFVDRVTTEDCEVMRMLKKGSYFKKMFQPDYIKELRQFREKIELGDAELGDDIDDTVFRNNQ